MVWIPYFASQNNSKNLFGHVFIDISLETKFLIPLVYKHSFS